MDTLTGFKTHSVLCIPVRSRDGVLLAVLQVGVVLSCCVNVFNGSIRAAAVPIFIMCIAIIIGVVKRLVFEILVE